MRGRGGRQVAGAESGQSSRQPAVQPPLPVSKLRSTLPLILGPSYPPSLQRNWVGWWRDPGLGYLSPISALMLSSQNWNLEHNCGETFEDPEIPLPSPSLFSVLQQLRSWDWLPSLKFFSCTRTHTCTTHAQARSTASLRLCLPEGFYRPRSRRLVSGTHRLPQSRTPSQVPTSLVSVKKRLASE